VHERHSLLRSYGWAGASVLAVPAARDACERDQPPEEDQARPRVSGASQLEISPG